MSIRALLSLVAGTRRRLVLLVFAALAVAGGGALAWAAATSSSDELRYEWSMPSRIGADKNGDGMVDYDTSAGYLNPTSWRVELDACKAPAITDRGATTAVTWTITGAALSQSLTVDGTCALSQSLPKLGAYTVTAKLKGDPSVTTTQTITLKDLFVVSVGDSVASGEGSPDTLGAKTGGLFPFYTPKWQDAQCDRSALAGPAQAAIRLENRDPHSSVTFLHLACSGAEIEKGLLGEYEGQHPKVDGVQLPPKPAQLAEAVRLAGWEQQDGVVTKTGRKIDSLFVSIGANNMGFGDIVKSCLAVQHCQHTDDDPVLGKRGGTIFAEGIKKLPALYEKLDKRFDEMGARGQLGNVYQTQYYDVSQFDDGSTCTGQTPQEKAGNVDGPNSSVDGFQRDEFEWTHTTVSPAINAEVKKAIEAGNATGGPQWTLVDGIQQEFEKHGYCAKDRWIRQLWESLTYQHGIDGSFHPNTEGQLYGYAKHLERVVAPAEHVGGEPVPFVAPDAVNLTVDGVGKFVGFLDRADAFETILSKIPFNGREWAQLGYQQLFAWIRQAQDKIDALSKDTSMSLTKLENTLDDLDGDNDPTSDAHIPGFPELTVDLDVDISPKALTKAYEVKVSLDVKLASSGPLKFLADGLTLGGQHVGRDLGFHAETTLRIAPFEATKVKVPTGGVTLAKVVVGFDGTYRDTGETKNPLSLKLGLLDASVTGTAKADIGAELRFVDKDGSGFIDATQLNNPAGLFRVDCVSGGSHLDLAARVGIAGLEGKLGSIAQDDPTLCDGIAPPSVELAELDGLRSLTIGDVINGVAQVTRAIQSAQAAGDLDLPFLDKATSAVAHVNDKLVKFFVDNGLTDPDKPLTTITLDGAGAKAIDNLPVLVTKLAAALGVPEGALNMRYANGSIRFDVKTSATPRPATAKVDLGDTLKRVGVTGVTGTATATVAPSYALDLGFGFSLADKLPTEERFFLVNGGNGIFTVDAPVTADLDLKGSVSALDVTLEDNKTDGPVTLLRRRDTGTPMLSVRLLDPNNDGVTTLTELATAYQGRTSPIVATTNATVPQFGLLARADILGENVASGTLTVEWPAVPATTGPDALRVTADGTFRDVALPFAFDTANPRALVTKLVGATREGIKRLRAAVAAGDKSTTTTLPLIGKSVADLDPVLAKLETSLDSLVSATDQLTLAALETKLNTVVAKALGATGAVLPTIVELGYEPKTGSALPAVTVRLDLGVCSADRAARSGCTITGKPVSAPFNLRLGKDSKAGGVAGISTTGQVDISYDAHALLTVGVELPRVDPGETADSLPSVRGTVALFVRDDSKLDFGVGLRLLGSVHAGIGPVTVDLGTAATPARGQLAARFALRAANPTGRRLVVGSAAFDDYLAALVPTSPATVHETDPGLRATCAGVADHPDACAILPVFVGSTDLGTITFHADDLLDPSTWDADSSEVEARLRNETVQFSLLVDGVRTLVRQLEKGLRSLPAGTKIPLIGADVTAGADLAKELDEKVISKLQDLATTLQGVGTVGALQAEANRILKQIPVVQASGIEVVVRCRDAAGAAVDCKGDESVTKLQSVEARLPLQWGINKTSAAFDLGFPGLRLSSRTGVTGGAAVQLTLAFGLDRDLGFYIPTGTAGPELKLGVTADLPHVVDQDDLTGQLAFLPIGIEDHHEGADVDVSVNLDITTNRADKRLLLQDLGSVELRPTIGANATVDLGINTRFDATTSGIPNLSARLKVNGSVNWDGRNKPATSYGITFDDVKVDSGSLVRNLLKPAAKTLRQYTKPLEPAVRAIKQPIPGVKEAAIAAGQTPPTWYELFKQIDDATRGTKDSGLQLIDRVITLVELTQAIDNNSEPSGAVDIGSFTVLPTVVSDPLAGADAASAIGSSSTTNTDVFKNLAFAGADQVAKATGEGGLHFPVFEKPTSLFQLLLGKDVPLVTFDAGRLAIERSMQFAYPIGPARLYIGGSAKLTGHFAAGFDTYGIRKAYEVLTDGDTGNDSVWDVAKGLLQGFYLDDNDTTGADVPEVTFRAELTAGAVVGIPGFQAGAEGGIGGQIDFNLHTDPEQEGKIRYTDIAKQLKLNPNPLCFFDASARIDAFIRAYVESPVGRTDFPIASGVVWEQPDLFRFCQSKPDDSSHTLATLDDEGVLHLRGTDAAQRLQVEQVSATDVAVSSDGLIEPYYGVKRVVADLGKGDDSLTAYQLAKFRPTPLFVCGGQGNDYVYTDLGPATVHGDAGGEDCETVPDQFAGNDTLQSGRDYAVTFHGDAGDDSLTSFDQPDTLVGGPGDDVLQGGDGDDKLDGGAGTDTVDYRDHFRRAVTVDFDGHDGQDGEGDDLDNFEAVIGTGVRDTVRLPAGGDWTVWSEGGGDVVTAGGGKALVYGTNGNDDFTGGTGDSWFYGGSGDDVIHDGSGADHVDGQFGRDSIDYSDATAPVSTTVDGATDDGTQGRDNVQGVEEITGSRYDDTIVADGATIGPWVGGGKAPDQTVYVRGGAGDDTLSSAATENVMEGGPGDDRLEVNGQSSVLRGGDGDDHLRGGYGKEEFSGGAGRDTVDYSGRSRGISITLDGSPNDGFHAPFTSVYEDDNVMTDNEVVIGTEGGDDIIGSSRDETLEGRGGGDHIKGGGGNDTFVGGDGDDTLRDVLGFGGEGSGVDGDGRDTFRGGPGQDYLQGNSGDDVFYGDDARDVVYAGQGDDTVYGGEGNDQIRGEDGVDTIDGENGSDDIDGGAGDDQLRGGTSTAGNGGGSIVGGTGNDTIWADTQGGYIYTGAQLVVNVEADAGPNTVHGSSARDDVKGGDGPDAIDLGNGDDVVHSFGGNDVVTLGDGDNTAVGGTGDDTITAGDGWDRLFGLDGDDTIRAGGGRDQVSGDDGDDKLYGEAGDDFGPRRELGVYGGPGNDLVDGGTGSDQLAGDEGIDTLSYADRTTAVTVDDAGRSGNADDESTTAGFPGRDIGADTSFEIIATGSGNDTVTLSQPGRTVPLEVRGGDGDDTVTIGDEVAVSAHLLGGEGADTLTGGAKDDTLDGGAGKDVEQGRGGADTFAQGTARNGADDLVGGAGEDTVDYRGRPAGTAYVTFDDVANDGARGEGDNVRADVEKALGARSTTPVEPTVSVAAVRVTEGAAGARTPAEFTVRLSEAGDEPVTVGWTLAAAAGDTATAGTDFVAASGRVTIAAGTTSATVTTTVLGDAAVEPDETATLTLTDAAGAALGTAAEAPLTIANDDVAAPAGPTVSVAGVSVPEGAAGTTRAAVLTATLSASSSKVVTVPWSVAPGTATAGVDYVAASGTLSIPAGTRSATVKVTVRGDALDEPNETATVTFGTGSNATVRTPTATLTIVDDDPAPTVSISGGSVLEGKAGRTTVLRYTVRLTAASGRQVSVRVQTSNGTASAGSDYGYRLATLTFAPGQTARTFDVTVRGDNAKERDETVVATLSQPAGTIIGTSRATGVIRNDDK